MRSRVLIFCFVSSFLTKSAFAWAPLKPAEAVCNHVVKVHQVGKPDFYTWYTNKKVSGFTPLDKVMNAPITSDKFKSIVCTVSLESNRGTQPVSKGKKIVMKPVLYEALGVDCKVNDIWINYGTTACKVGIGYDDGYSDGKEAEVCFSDVQGACDFSISIESSTE